MTTPEAAGANCATGGLKLEQGLDANDDGVLQPGEIAADQTRFVCNGATGSTGPTGSQGPSGASGATGPSGPAGADGASVTGMSLAPGNLNCPSGGAAFTIGTTTTYACNGADGAPGATGNTGLQGIQGIQGVQGTQGPPGVPGPQGPAGVAGTLDSGCPGPRIGGVCLLAYNNTASFTFVAAAGACTALGGDLCTDSQAWPLAVGNWQNVYLAPAVLSGPHWTASFADNDSGSWTGANGGTGDDHAPGTLYGYACCGGATPIDARVPTQSINNVVVTGIHNTPDTYWSGAVAYCGALGSDICSESQNLLLRDAGALSVATWTNAHSDNDASLYAAINGGTSDDPGPTNRYGFACCPSRRPSDLSCPVARTSGVCAPTIHDTADSDFRTAANACAATGADLCSISELAVLRGASAITGMMWSNSHSDNDAGNASVGVGAMPDNPSLTMASGYACCVH